MPPKGTQKSNAKRTTTTPKASLPVEEKIKRHFKSLCAQIDGGYFKNAIKTCDKSERILLLGCDRIVNGCTLVLRLDTDDKDALKAKLFLLLQTERYNEALSLIEQLGGANKFEKAYSFYRLNREDDALQLTKELKDEGTKQDRGVAHLEAQLVRLFTSIHDAKARMI